MAKHKAPIEKCRVGIRWWWRRAHPRSRTGVLITLGYLVVMLLTVLVRSEAFLKMELNALGDFMAGTFAPLALLWLVIGYFQQGDELRQNSRALLLQAKELRQAAEHAGGLLDVARKEHELAIEKLRAEGREREIAAEQKVEAREQRRKQELQPLLSFSFASIEKTGGARVKLTNYGHGCSDFSLEIPDNAVLKLLQPIEVSNLEARATVFVGVQAIKRLGTTPVIAWWSDAEGDRFKSEFIASIADNQLNIDKLGRARSQRMPPGPASNVG